MNRSPSPDTRRRSPLLGDRRRSISPRGGHGRSTSPRRRSPSPNERRAAPSVPREHASKEILPSTVLGVFNLNLFTRERQLEDLFGKYGPLDKVTIVYDTRSQRSRGFGFVTFKEQADADKARKECNGMMFDGRAIRVDYSETKGAHAPTPGRYLGDRRPDPHTMRYERQRLPYYDPYYYDRMAYVPPPPMMYRRDYNGDRVTDRFGDVHPNTERLTDQSNDRYGGRGSTRSDRYNRRSPSPQYRR